MAEGDAADVPGEHGEGVEQPVGLDVHAEHVLEVGRAVGEEDVEEEGVGAVREDGRPEGQGGRDPAGGHAGLAGPLGKVRGEVALVH